MCSLPYTRMRQTVACYNEREETAECRSGNKALIDETECDEC